MSAPFTLQQLKKNVHTPNWANSTLIVVDAQRAYTEGLLALPNISATLPHLSNALATARAQNVPIVHILHKGGEGSPFDPAAVSYQPIPEAMPLAEETVIEKTMADSFTGTTLNTYLETTGRKEAIIVGYMTHNCVDATVRSAVHKGYPTTVIANACTTRDLPQHNGGTVPAQELHDAVLSGLSDALATIVQDVSDIA